MRADDPFTVRGIARGDEGAVSRLLEAQFDRVYGLLRLVLATTTEIEAAVCATFAAATRRAGEPLSRRDPGGWLTQLTVEQIRARTRDDATVYLSERRARREEAAEPADLPPEAVDTTLDDVLLDVLEGIPDHSLTVLIRTIKLQPRRALVLGEICGLGDEEVAGTIGCPPEQVRRLKAEAVAKLRASFREHAQREEELKQQISTVPYHLRTHADTDAVSDGGGGKNHDTVIKGTRVYLRPRRPGVLTMMRRFIERLLRGRRFDKYDGNDEVGGGGRARNPEPTPTLQAFEKPKATPTIQGYRQPKATPGMANYAAPKNTPTTRRISNPRAAATAWSGSGAGFHRGAR